ncbi:hypothetical protein INT44_001748 [Umbelopsis vinacea]|uniref:RING-type domain-containing protein n=1 Tax=Umbelopsis vinacea TaxID=44442 RepID=A0A8H7UD56_9FUNG|nr:hypothetical protein INT44_001748 [Umbelopsis vinacea]
MSNATISPSSATTSANSSATSEPAFLDSMNSSTGWSEAARWAINAVVIAVVIVASGFFYYRYRKLRRMAMERELPPELASDARRHTTAGTLSEEENSVLDHEQLAILPVSKYDPDKVRNSTCPICLEDFDLPRHRRHSNQSMSSSFTETDMADAIVSKPPSVLSVSRSFNRPQTLDETSSNAQRPANRRIRRLPCGHGFCVACIAKSEYSYEDSRTRRCASPTHSPSMLSYSYYRYGRPQDGSSHLSIQMDSIAPRPDSVISSQLLNDESASLGRPQSVARPDTASERASESQHRRSESDTSFPIPSSIRSPPEST